MISFQNSDSGGTSHATADPQKYELSNIVETKMLYLSTKSSQCTQLNGSMKSRVSFDLRSYLDFAGDDTIQSITLSMPYAILCNSNYQINSTNNTLYYTINGGNYKAVFPNGNYTTDTFMPTFVSVLTATSGAGFSISLNSVNGMFMVTNLYNSFTFLGTSTINYILGFSDTISSNIVVPFQETAFIGSIAANTNQLTVSSTFSPNFSLTVSQYIIFYDPNTSVNVTAQIATITGKYTYTLNTTIGTTAILNSNIITGAPYGIFMPRLCNFLPNPLFRIVIENNSLYNGTVLGSAGQPQYSNVLASIPNVTKQNTQVVYQNFSDEFAIQASGQTTLILGIMDDNNNYIDFNGISSYFQLRIRIYRRIKRSLSTFVTVLEGATKLRNLIEEESETIEKPLDKIL